MTNVTELEPDIKVLRAYARDTLDTSHITGDETDDDGNQIEIETYLGPAGNEVEIEHNLTAMYAAGPSTTGDVSLLVLEAEMKADEDYTVANPHIPITTAVRDAAAEKLESKGLEPAWKQVGQEESP